MQDITLTVPPTARRDAMQIMENFNLICKELGFLDSTGAAMRESWPENGNSQFLVDSDIFRAVTSVMMRLMDIYPEQSESEQLTLF